MHKVYTRLDAHTLGSSSLALAKPIDGGGEISASDILGVNHSVISADSKEAGITSNGQWDNNQVAKRGQGQVQHIILRVF